MKKQILQLTLTGLIVLTTISFKSYTQTNWTVTGNSAINPNTNFLGTTNNKPIIFKTNKIERMRLLGDGKFGIGITNPETKLHINGNASVSLTKPGLLMLGDKKKYNIAMDGSYIQSRYKWHCDRFIFKLLWRHSICWLLQQKLLGYSGSRNI